MDPEIARLKMKHADLDRRVKELDARRWLSGEEQIECTRLKKEKLATKDKIARLESAVRAP